MNSINLLPPEIKSDIEQKKRNSSLLKILNRSIFFLIVVAITSILMFLYLSSESIATNRKLESAEKEITNFGQLEKDATKIAEKLNAIKTIESKLNHWPNVVKEIQTVMPSGITLSKISLSSDSKIRGSMSGFAKNKDAVATLRDSLDNSPYFEYVDIESASTEINPKTKEDQESFTLSFSLSKEALNE